MTYLTIGEFAARTRLSPKALRIYDDLGLVVPARVDPSSGYRQYDADQVDRARLVGLLRRLDLPLATIGAVLALDGEAAAQAVTDWWDQLVATTAERRALVGYLRARLRGEDNTVREIETRSIPERSLLSISRHVDGAGIDRFFDEAFARLRAPGSRRNRRGAVPGLLRRGQRRQ